MLQGPPEEKTDCLKPIQRELIFHSCFMVAPNDAYEFYILFSYCAFINKCYCIIMFLNTWHFICFRIGLDKSSFPDSLGATAILFCGRSMPNFFHLVRFDSFSLGSLSVEHPTSLTNRFLVCMESINDPMFSGM